MGASAHAYQDVIYVFGGLPGADPSEAQPLDDHWAYNIGRCVLVDRCTVAPSERVSE
jgi:hypothetical protein